MTKKAKNSYDRQGISPKASHKSGATTVISTNSQVSLYSSSSEEPLNAIRKETRFKTEHPTSGKKLVPSGTKESRIPRKTILRRQLGKNILDKSESESEGRDPTESQDSAICASRHQLIKSRSLPSESRNVEDPITQPRIVSPPVPAVARCLAKKEQSRKDTNTRLFLLLKTKKLITNYMPITIIRRMRTEQDQHKFVETNRSITHHKMSQTRQFQMLPPDVN